MTRIRSHGMECVGIRKKILGIGWDWDPLGFLVPRHKSLDFEFHGLWDTNSWEAWNWGKYG